MSTKIKYAAQLRRVRKIERKIDKMLLQADMIMARCIVANI